MLIIKSHIGFILTIKEAYVWDKYPIWEGFKLIWESIYVHFICKLQEDPIKTEGVMLMTMLNRRFFSAISGRNSKINDPIWSGFELIWDFIHVPLICKFQEDLIKYKQIRDGKV